MKCHSLHGKLLHYKVGFFPFYTRYKESCVSIRSVVDSSVLSKR